MVQVDIIDSGYYTVKKPFEAASLIEEKKSKFICHVYPVDSEKKAFLIISQLKEKYKDASHNCFAYSVISDGVVMKKFSDDSEPKKTAGMPILKVIESKKMQNILVVITRYFGGTLLGAGKLSRMYKRSAASGLENIDAVLIKPMTDIFIRVDYQDFSKLEGVLTELGVRVLDKEFGASVSASLQVEKQHLDKVLFTINDITNGRALIKND